MGGGHSRSINRRRMSRRNERDGDGRPTDNDADSPSDNQLERDAIATEAALRSDIISLISRLIQR